VVLVIAVADPAVGAIVLEHARELAPNLDVVVRTHAERTATRLRAERGIWPVVGERELAIQMSRVALRRFGVSGIEAEAIAQGLRSAPPDPPSDDGPGLTYLGPRAMLDGIRARLSRRDAAAEPAEEAGVPAPAPAGDDDRASRTGGQPGTVSTD
jgi:hypothetical protein